MFFLADFSLNIALRGYSLLIVLSPKSGTSSFVGSEKWSQLSMTNGTEDYANAFYSLPYELMAT